MGGFFSGFGLMPEPRYGALTANQLSCSVLIKPQK
jgi:hypothetical protein